jgi:DNA-binding MarR family transcriptional regulator
MTAPTLWAPALAQSCHDRRLSTLERVALLALWQSLSPVEWLPMKTEALGSLVGVKRQNAARLLRRLVECGYLVVHHPHPREPRLFLLVNVVAMSETARAA